VNVRDLMDLLDQYDGDAEVRLMTQESYPFQNSIRGCASAEEIGPDPDEVDEEGEPEPLGDFNGPVEGNTVYILEGRQLGYGYKAAWNGQ